MSNPAFLLKLDHAAIATSDVTKLKNIFRLLGLKDGGTEDVPSQKVRTHFIVPEAGRPQVEILESTDTSSAVQRFLEKKGSGIHHLSFLLEKGRLDDLCTHLRKNGVRLVYDTPQAGAHQTRVNFIHPESTGGVLIEISEKTAK